MSADSKVLVCLSNGANDPEAVLVAYLIGVEALSAGKQSVIFLLKDAVHVATPGFAESITLANAPSIAKLHAEYVAKGGRFFACPVAVRMRGMHDAEWVPNTEVTGMPSVFDYTKGGALVFSC